MNDIYSVLNALSELVYIADPETYELLYVNRKGIELFQLGDYQGQKCHKAFQNLDHPCPFCTNAKLCKEQFYTWEFQNRITGRYFVLRDKLIEWEDGRTVRLEIAFDNTPEKQQQLMLKTMLDTETVLVDCLRELHRAGSIQTAIHNILSTVGKFLEAERVYIFSIRGDRMDNTYEWCAPGISAEISHLQDLDIRLLDEWLPDFNAGRCHKISNVEESRVSSPMGYQVLKAQGIHSLIAAPMEADGKLIGYMGIDNPPKDMFSISESFFPSLSFFLSSALEKQRQADKLR